MPIIPKVSILTTAFNREELISETIESVLCSSYENFELIIVDDNSSDKTIEVAQTYKKLDNRIKIYKNKFYRLVMSGQIDLQSGIKQLQDFPDGQAVFMLNYLNGQKILSFGC